MEVFPLNESLKVINSLTYYSILIAIITLIFAEILAIFFTRSIVNPISKLKKLMKKTEEGNFDVVFNSKYNDERIKIMIAMKYKNLEMRLIIWLEKLKN